MQLLVSLAFLASLRAAAAHGGHDKPAEGETIQQYALRHMATEHHIDTFDIPSFFHIHDLNRDGVWDKEEIEAVYVLQPNEQDDIEHQKKAEHIVKEVLKRLDKNGDGKITLREFEAVGLEGLPNFDDLGAEGHHYDVESEFFLHHEAVEQFHSTPETQTDESYNHPEDIEHFAHHEAIERQEAEREAKFQGVSVEEVIAQHEPHEEQHVPEGGAADPQLVVQNPHDDQAFVAGGPPKINRVPPPEKQDPAVRFASAKADAENQGECGGQGLLVTNPRNRLPRR
ncbi:hypothetical protein BN946_scf185007.g178 [Trametes cinnabarina]|uniref:EF-hand domain-containing protein n=1 Tax=Pycnoporus cinnabarinus TaxID=5643 RepID=A0A060SLL2_PYCCI|nr:hypothetical protein BN946_scf185007.g178 [Trametes cinnabarina]